MSKPVRLGCVGLSYLSAPVEVRERLAEVLPRIEAEAARLTGIGALDGCVLLSTCNRVELYASAQTSPVAQLQDLLRTVTGSTFLDYVRLDEDVDVAQHLFRVAAGLDSMVLGEPQILGQVGEALRRAEEMGLASQPLQALFHAAGRVGKRARSETGLNRNPVSVASVAVDVAARETKSLKDRHVTVFGAGDMAGLVAKLLRARGVQHATVVNRTEERGAALARRCGYAAAGADLDALLRILAQTDVVVCATGAPHTIVEPEHLQGRSKPIVLIDLAVPRDINPAVADMRGVQLFDIDQLHEQVDTSLEMRRREIPAVENILQEELDQFTIGLRTQVVEPVIVGLRRKAEAIRLEELKRSFGDLEAMSPADRKQLSIFSKSLVNKLLHDPTQRLRERAANLETNGDTAVVRSLFGL